MAGAGQVGCSEISARELAELAKRYESNGNIGVAFTYNEPLVGYEFVRDVARLVHGYGMKSVMVTNGFAELWVLDELLPHMDAMNIDLKGFTEEWYEKLGGRLDTVKSFIKGAAAGCHVELTTLIVPGENDSQQEMEEAVSYTHLDVYKRQCLMRPSKSVLDIEVKSVKKKFKDKHFAAGVDRDIIRKGCEMLGMELDDVIRETIAGMREKAEEIGLKGNL